MRNIRKIYRHLQAVCWNFGQQTRDFLVSQAALPTLNVEDGKAIHEIAVSLVTLKCTDVLDDVLIMN